MVSLKRPVGFKRYVLSSQVVGKGISEAGLTILNKSGIAMPKTTQRRELCKSAKSHDKSTAAFINDSLRNEDLLVLMIDDYTNIHTKHRPKSQETSAARTMATILLKRFKGIPGIPAKTKNAVKNPDGASSDLLVRFLETSFCKLSTSYASTMPSWIRAAFLTLKWKGYA